MPALMRDRVARFIVSTAFFGSLLDWILFATMVLTVDTVLGSTSWATTVVLVARIVPGVVFAPIAARQINGSDLARSLRLHEALRVAAVAGLAVAAATSSAPGAIAAILVMEYAAAMQAAGRESAISRHVPSGLFARLNTSTAVISYGFLPIGPIIVGVVGATTGWIIAVTGGLAIAAAYLRLDLTGPSPSSTALEARAVSRSEAGGRASTVGAWRRVTIAASLGVLPVVALFTLGPDVAEWLLGTRTATGTLYGFVLVGGAIGFALANTARFRADLAMLTAALGVLLVTIPGAWMAGLLLLGVGAGGAYLDLQTRLQHAASDPSEFAAAFATLKVTTMIGVVAAPAVANAAGLPVVLLAGMASAIAGSVVAASVDVGTVARRMVRALLTVVVDRVVAVRVTNPERRVPGPAVVVSNHPNWLDGAVALRADETLRPIARWQPNLLARVAIWAGDCVVTTHGTDQGPRAAFDGAANHLREGGRIWLAPEGGSHTEERLRQPRSGAIRMATAAGVPVQSLGIRWTDQAQGPSLGRLRPWRRTEVELTWGVAFVPSGDAEIDTDQMMAELARAAGMQWHPSPSLVVV